MKISLYGIQKVDFTSDDGKKISGTKLHCTYPDSRIQGLCSKPLWVPSEVEIPKDLKLNTTIDVEFNHNKQVIGIRTQL